jgi:rubredoxin
MGERVLRGSRLGGVSYESDRNTDLAPRREARYDCPQGHSFGMPFAVEADVPAIWECRICGATALLRDGEEPEAKKGKPARTHWDMLMERRTTEDLEEVLAERLALLRGGGPAKKTA